MGAFDPLYEILDWVFFLLLLLKVFQQIREENIYVRG